MDNTPPLMSQADRALAASFAGNPTDFKPLTEADRLAADVAYAQAKDTGALRRRDDELALALQVADQTMLAVLGRAL